MNSAKPTLEVCFCPPLFKHKLTQEHYITVVVDILRASTSICTALFNGANKIIPVPTVEMAATFVGKGNLIAGERDGAKLEIADLGNSPFQFSAENVSGRNIVMTTTNGTHTIELAKSSDQIVIGAFVNISVLTQWLIEQNKNAVIFCSGWKNKFNLEDTAFAGALAERLLASGNFNNICDSASAALDLWSIAKLDLNTYINKALHHQRLTRMGFEDVIPYCLSNDLAPVVPILKDNEIVKV